MKKMWKFMAVVALLLGAIATNAQTGYYVLSGNDLKGNPGGLNKDADNLFNNSAAWTDIIQGTDAGLEKFSTQQTLPFAFKFNGVDVTNYYVASAGYVTFGDITGKTVSTINENLPSANLPDKTIAFWGMSGKKCTAVSTNYGSVRTRVFGTAPNRQLYVNFFAVTNAADNNSVGFYSIVMEETTNRIYLVDQWMLHIQGGTFQQPGLTLGIQIDGTTAINLPAGGNNYLIQSQNPENTDNVYSVFIPGTQPAVDAKLVGVEFPTQLIKDENTVLKASLFNTGSSIINTADFNYKINDGTTQTASLSSLNIASAGTKSISHTTPINSSNGGETLTLKTWFTNINGQAISTDTVVSIAKVILGLSGTKKVLLEEFSTAPCQFCPDGAVVLEDIEAFYGDDIIIVQHHAGFGTDKMTIPEHSAYAAAFAPGAPTATVDRKFFNGETAVGISRTIWEDKSIEQLENSTPFDVSLTSTYDTAARKVTINVGVNVLDYVSSGDYRANIFIVEDSVAHPNLSGYNQVNYYNNIAGHPYQGAGNPIKGYVHRKVVRAVPTTTWGDASIFSGSIEPGATFTKTYTYTIPAKYDVLAPNLEGMHIVAFVSKYDAADNTNHYVFNANRVKLDAGSTGTSIASTAGNFVAAKVYPNPISKNSIIEFEATDNVNSILEVFDVTGKMVFTKNLGTITTGVNKIALEEVHTVLSNGIYMLNIKGGKSLIQSKITVNN